MDKESGSGIFPDQDPGDPKRPDPTGSGSATLIWIKGKYKYLDRYIETYKASEMGTCV